MKAVKKANAVLYIVIFAMFILGIILGIFVPGMFPAISFLGDIYVKLLKIIIIPLLMSQIIVGIYGTVRSFASRIVKVIVLFIIMFVISFLITALITGVLCPGNGINLFGDDWEGELAATTVSGFFSGIITDNIFSSMQSNAILPCILFAFAFGIAAAGVKAEKTINVLGEISRIFSKLLEYFMWFSPVGVFALMGNAIATYGSEIIGLCAIYIGFAWGISLVVMAVVMILPPWIFAGISPVKYISRVAKIWVITLSTCSSAATLPSTIRVCNEEFGVPEDVTGIVVPLGCTIHMCGGAVSFCLLGMFTMQMAGVQITAGLFLYMLLVATLMNMAAPGIPGGGIVLGATYLTILGAPTGFIGMYSGIYRLLDMSYTTLNVTGDITANILIADHEKKHAEKAGKCK